MMLSYALFGYKIRKQDVLNADVTNASVSSYH